MPKVGAHVTDAEKAAFTEIASQSEQFSAPIVCDDIEDMYESEVINSAGALSPAAMRLVDQGLKAALDLD